MLEIVKVRHKEDDLDAAILWSKIKLVRGLDRG